MTKIQQGTPLAYLTGQQEFWSLNFKVNEHTLIPRPDTERLIEAVLNHHKNSLSKPMDILDLGTGSGCIAITLAEEFKNSYVSAVDKSAEALKVAAQNAKRIAPNSSYNSELIYWRETACLCGFYIQNMNNEAETIKP